MDYNNFTLKERCFVDEINSECMYYIHNRTKSRVIFIKNNDEQKSFMIGFNTPINDSTGIAHVVEHAVLSGSKKYPSDRAFVSIAKRSINNFMNAATFEDSTYYFISSNIDEEFSKLSDVYMDFVFNSNLLRNDKIFYENRGYVNCENQITTGIVYNEMKGIYSDLKSYLQRKSQFSLFQNSCYGYDYGGDPEQIINLEYDAAKSFYKKYYTPSNSYIFFYGDIDIKKKLQWIEDHYNNINEKEQPQLIKSEFQEIKKYNIFSYCSTEDQAKHFTYNIVIKRENNKFQDIQLYVLANIFKCKFKDLINPHNESDCFFKDIDVFLNTSIQNKVLTFLFFSCKIDMLLEEFESNVNKLFLKFLNSDFWKKDIHRVLNNLIYYNSINNTSEVMNGIHKGFQIMSNLRYSDTNVFECLKEQEHINFLWQNIKIEDYKNIIKNEILENSHKTICMFQYEKKKQSYVYNSDEIIINLKKSSIDNNFITSQNCNNMKFIKHDINYYSKDLDDLKIIYHLNPKIKQPFFHIFFKLNDLNSEEYNMVSVLSMILGQIDTADYTYHQLAYKNVNRMETNISVYDKKNIKEKSVFFDITSIVFQDKIEELFNFIEQIIWESDFSDINRIRFLLNDSFSLLKGRIYANQPQSVAVERALSSFSGASYVNDCLAGISCYKFLKKILEYDDEKLQNFIIELFKLYKRIFFKKNILIFYSGNSESKEFEDAILSLYNKKRLFAFTEVPITEYEQHITKPLDLYRRAVECIPIDSDVQYVALGFVLNIEEINNFGAFLVAQSLIEEMYLWTNLRELRGVYGFMCEFRENGKSYFVSYRDPNCFSTWKVFMNIPKFLQTCYLDDELLEMTKIGVLGKINKCKSYLDEANEIIACFCKNEPNNAEKIFKQVVKTEIKDIRKIGLLLESKFNEASVCTLGNKIIIEEDTKKIIKERY